MPVFLFLIVLLAFLFIAHAIIALHETYRYNTDDKPPIWFLTIAGLANIGMITYFIISEFCN